MHSTPLCPIADTEVCRRLHHHRGAGGEIVGQGLTVTAAGLNNAGELAAASGDLTVNITRGGFTNLSGSTLTGGTYLATYSGNLFLNVGGVIAVDAAKIELE